MADPVKEVSDALTELALDLRWSWNHAADELWAQLDPGRWDLTRNAWVVLQTVARDRLEAVAADPEFKRKLDQLIEDKHRARRNSALVPAYVPEFASHRRRLLQPRVHAERRTADLLRRSGQRGGRPVEIGQRPRHPRHRHRAALSARLLPPAHRRAGPAAGALSVQRSGPASHHAGAHAKWRMAERRRWTCPVSN